MGIADHLALMPLPEKVFLLTRAGFSGGTMPETSVPSSCRVERGWKVTRGYSLPTLRMLHSNHFQSPVLVILSINHFSLNGKLSGKWQKSRMAAYSTTSIQQAARVVPLSGIALKGRRMSLGFMRVRLRKVIIMRFA